jgi:hypothetical protein
MVGEQNAKKTRGAQKDRLFGKIQTHHSEKKCRPANARSPPEATLRKGKSAVIGQGQPEKANKVCSSNERSQELTHHRRDRSIPEGSIHQHIHYTTHL